MSAKSFLTRALYKAGFLPPIHATFDEYTAAVEKEDPNASRMAFLPKPRTPVMTSLCESFIRAGYKAGVLKPLSVDYPTYERAVESGNPNRVRMVRSAEPKEI